MLKSIIQNSTRRAWVLSIYRGLLTLFLLISLLDAFPEYQTVAIFAVIVFSQGIAAIQLGLVNMFTIQNALSDAADQKTRHTMLLALEPDWSRGSDFWAEVDRRMTEDNPVVEHKSAWVEIGLGLASFSKLIVIDIVVVTMALILSN